MRRDTGASRLLDLDLAATEAREQETSDDVPTLWVDAAELAKVLERLSPENAAAPWMLSDLFAFDDALTTGDGTRGVTLVYAFMRFSPAARLRVKVRLEGSPPEVTTSTPFFPNADWFEREVFARAGVRFSGHPSLAALPDDPNAGAAPADELDVDVDLPRALAFETLAGIEAPPRAQAIRVLLSELLRVASHLFWYGAFAETSGAVAPALYASLDGRRMLEAAHTLGGAHPERVVVGGVAHELPNDWRSLLDPLVEEMEMRTRDYDEMLLASGPMLAATKGVCPISSAGALAWGITGPVLRSAGLPYDVRTAFPYAGYERYDVVVPTGVHGDLYDRARVRLAEVRQSLALLSACATSMPEGPHVVAVPAALPPGEAQADVESSRGVSSCFVASDGGSLFVHSRTPSFSHLQALQHMSVGYDDAEASVIASSVDLAAGAGR